MPNVVLDMAMSLDGFIAGPNDADHGLHNYLFSPSGGTVGVIKEGFKTTGAIIIGRRSYEIGADIFQQCLNKGLVNELQISIAPVLLGDGLLLFEHINAETFELETTDVIESAGITHLRYRVVKEN